MSSIDGIAKCGAEISVAFANYLIELIKTLKEQQIQIDELRLEVDMLKRKQGVE